MKTRFIFLMTLTLLAACAAPQATPQSADLQPAPVFTAFPTLTDADKFAVWIEPRIFRHPGISTP